MDFQVVALGDFPIERGMTRSRRFNMHFMAYIVYAAGVVCDYQTDYVHTNGVVDMGWVSTIPFCPITKDPMITHDIMVACRGAVEMNFKVIALCRFPGKGGIAFGADGFHNDFMTDIVYAS